MSLVRLLVAYFSFAPAVSATFHLAQEFIGDNFFTGWDFSGGYDDTTSGDVNWLSNATSAGLAYIKDGNAIITIDNTSVVPWLDKRNSVRMQTQEYYPIGSVFLMDASHVPFGCSVWPGFWTKGKSWPYDGEIDIMEQVNLAQTNQMTLHAAAGCTQATNVMQTGTTISTNCSQGVNASVGCSVGDTRDTSFGKGFADNGGGVWATQFDDTGVFIWFWPRNEVPSSLNSSTSIVDPSTWGTPAAAWPSSSCNISQEFDSQQLVVDITLCGIWAGDPQIYQSTCGGPLGNSTYDTCYIENVASNSSLVNNGTNYHDAYFDISYIKVFTSGPFINGSTGNGTSTNSTGSGNSTGDHNTSDGIAALSFPYAHFATVYVAATIVFTALSWI